jgi:hypothetical protein
MSGGRRGREVWRKWMDEAYANMAVASDLNDDERWSWPRAGISSRCFSAPDNQRVLPSPLLGLSLRAVASPAKGGRPASGVATCRPFGEAPVIGGYLAH